MHIVLWAAAALAAVLVGLLLRERRLRAKRDLMRQILDLADELESGLRECRRHLRELPSSAANESASTAAEPADAAVDAGLRDVLANRLWLQREGQRASVAALSQARDALAEARQTLQSQLARLADARADLDEVFATLAAAKEATRR